MAKKNGNPKVDQKFRVGGSASIDHGAKGGGMGPDHSMSIGVHHVERVPTDKGQFDQHHGVAPDAIDGE